MVGEKVTVVFNGKLVVDDVVLDSMLIPAAQLGTRVLHWFRWVQRGSMQAYLLYILLTLIVLFFWK